MASGKHASRAVREVRIYDGPDEPRGTVLRPALNRIRLNGLGEVRDRQVTVSLYETRDPSWRGIEIDLDPADAEAIAREILRVLGK